MNAYVKMQILYELRYDQYIKHYIHPSTNKKYTVKSTFPLKSTFNDIPKNHKVFMIIFIFKIKY